MLDILLSLRERAPIDFEIVAVNLQRVQIKQMIRDWEKQHPGRIENMFTAMANISPSHMMDRQLYPFTTIKATGQPEPNGDIAFDEDEQCGTPAPGVIRLV
jgi:tRNA 2-thiocytidine biosynthesis protein TtcA